MADEHVKRYPTSLVTREMQSITKMAKKTKKTKNTKGYKSMCQVEPSYTANRNEYMRSI
jgi:hypothetical protein